jgi:hypothetical protein
MQKALVLSSSSILHFISFITIYSPNSKVGKKLIVKMVLFQTHLRRWSWNFSSITNTLIFFFTLLTICDSRAIRSTNNAIDLVNSKLSRHVEDRLPTKRMATVPSVPYIRSLVINGQQMTGKTSIFWTNFNPPNTGYNAAKSFKTQLQQAGNCNAITYNECLPPSQFEYFQSANVGDEPTAEQYIDKIRVLSAAYAQTSSGVAYVLVPDGLNPLPTSTWILYELPNLTASGSGVTQITRVNWPSGTQQEIWKSGNGQQGIWPPTGANQDIFSG